MAVSQIDATVTNNSKRSNRIYKDLNMSFTKNPATKDVARLFDVQAIKRAVKNIILTNKYERPFNPDFGCNLRGFLFENITEPLLVIIKDRVAMAIEKYEPRVSVEDVVVKNDIDKNGINIQVSFLINGVEAPVTVSTFLQRVR
jgi:hypothetical protein|tara:strand:- start:66 stop:497 length:432 start_codon:yes stop_codon:yes gene_type:complete